MESRHRDMQVMGNKQNPKLLDVFLFSIVDYIYTQSFETWGAVVQEKRRDKDFNRGVFHHRQNVFQAYLVK